MIPIIATGLSGLVGTRIKALLAHAFDFHDLSLATGVDIANPEEVTKAIRGIESSVILHMAAKTNVDACEEDKIFGEEGEAWQVNVFGTQHIVDAAKHTGKRIIYISTDFVFDGTKKRYTEEDEPNPVNWYGRTKHEGECIIVQSGIPYTIIRIAYPYARYTGGRKDFVRRIVEIMEEKKPIVGVIDHIFTPTCIDDIATGLSFFLTKHQEGIFHIVGSQSLTVFDAVKMIGEVFHYTPTVRAVKRNEYFRGRAFRPFQLALGNDKIRKLGLNPKTFSEGLAIVKQHV